MILCLLLLSCHVAVAETGAEGWLRYAPVADPIALHRYDILPNRIVVLGRGPVERTAAAELARGLQSMLARKFTVEYRTEGAAEKSSAIVLGTAAAFRHDDRTMQQGKKLGPDAFTFLVEGERKQAPHHH